MQDVWPDQVADFCDLSSPCWPGGISSKNPDRRRLFGFKNSDNYPIFGMIQPTRATSGHVWLAQLFTPTALCCLAGLLIVTPAVARAGHGPLTNIASDRAPAVVEQQLKNGLRVVLSPDELAQSVAVCTLYDAGTRRQARDQVGIAHLVAAIVGGREYELTKEREASVVKSRGGQLTSSVGEDFARFCTVVPPAELQLAVWLEAGHMSRQSVDSRYFEQKKAELVSKYESPERSMNYTRGLESLGHLVFESYEPYDQAGLPAPWQLAKRNLGEARRFHRTYYRSNHAFMAIAGRFQVSEAQRLLTLYLDHPQFQGRALPEFGNDRPRQLSERLSVLEQPGAKTSAVFYGWWVPPRQSPEHRGLELLCQVLCDGQASLLYDELVRERGLARDVSCWTEGRKGPGLFVIRVFAERGKPIDPIEERVGKALAKLQNTGLSASQLELARQKLRVRRLGLMDDPRGRASMLAEAAFFGEPPGNLSAAAIEDYEGITSQQIAQAAGTYLTKYTRSIVEMYPEGWHDPSQAPMPRYHIVKRGETLIGIAKRWGTTAREIAKVNGISTKKPIFPGQKFRVPPGAKPGPAAAHKGSSKKTNQKKKANQKKRTYLVKKGDTLSGIALRFGVSVHQLAAYNGLKRKGIIRPGQSLTIPPKTP